MTAGQSYLDALELAGAGRRGARLVCDCHWLLCNSLHHDWQIENGVYAATRVSANTDGVCFDEYIQRAETFEIELRDCRKGLSLAVFKRKLKLRGCRMKAGCGGAFVQTSGIYGVNKLTGFQGKEDHLDV